MTSEFERRKRGATKSASHIDHRILVVEDDQGFASLIQKVMQQAGFSTETVSTGADAVKWIEEVRRTLDILLLLDYRLPDMTGKELIEILSQDQTNVPFIMITGHGDEKVAIEMMKLGACDYLIKDKNLLDLLPVVVNRVVQELANEQQLIRTEEELQESEKKFRSIFESFADVYYRSDKESRISIISPSVRAFGYEPEELIGRPSSDFYFDVSERELFLNELNKHGEVRDYEIRLKDKDGKLIDVSANAHIIYDKYGNPDGIEGVLRDITERKRTEEQLLLHFEQTKTLRNVIEKLNRTVTLEDICLVAIEGILNVLHVDRASVLLADPDGVVRFKAWDGLSTKYRKAVEGHFPWEKDDLNAQPIFLQDIAEADLSEELKSTVLNEGIHACALIPLKGSKTLLGKFIIYYNQPHSYESDEISLSTVLADNLATAIERLQGREELRKSEEKYRTLVEEMNEELIVSDTDEVITMVNPRMCEIMGASDKSQLVGHILFDFLDDKNHKVLDKAMKRRRKGVSETYELTLKRIDGTPVVMQVSASPILDDKGTYIGSFGVSSDITEKKQAEDALKESGEKYRNIFEYSHIGIALHQNGKVVFGNPAAVQMLGYDSTDEIIGKPVIEFVHPDYRAVAGERIKGLLKDIGAVAVMVEEKFIRKNGTPVDVAVMAQSILFGGTPAIQISFLDITEQKQAEESIRQLSAFPEENPHPIFSTDLKGKVKYANPAAIHILEEIGGKHRNIAWLLPRNRKKLIEEALKEKKVVMTDEYKRGNGVFVCQIHIPEGSDTAHLYLTEVTERVWQEEQSKRLLTAVEQAAESIIITDTKGIIQYVNPLFEQTTGYSRKKAIGQSLRNFKTGLQDRSQYQKIWNTITDGKVWSGYLSHKNRDGNLYKEETIISPVRNKSGKIHNFVFVCRDVTQEIALEEQLRQAQKLEAIGQLAGGIAHDFNNILTGIIGYSDLALASLPKEHELRETFNAIIRKSDDAATLIRQLLAFSRKQILDIRLSDLNHILQQTAQFLERVLRDDIKLTMKLNKSPCSFNADTTAIQQIITNLCVNAQDAMSSGGEITISTSNVSLDESYCNTRPEIKPGEYIKLSVSDTGTGIEKDIRDHIYEPFFTTKEVGVGSGLGLSTVYGLVRQHNGYIECISTPGKATVFELYFPQMKKAIIQKKEVTTVEKVEGKETILIVEDDIDVLNVLKNILNQSGYSTLIAKNGLEGLKILILKRKDIDLVITDIYMPEMSGIELYEKTIEFGNDIRFLFITGYASQEIKSITNLGVELMQKPFTSIQLTQKIQEILDN